MYSVVLMMALTGGADVPAGHHGRGCNGGCYGCAGYGYGCCGGCNGCAGGYGADFGAGHGGAIGGYPMTTPGAVVPGTVVPGTAAPARPEERIERKPKGEVMAPAPAVLIVSLPADAKLMIDDEPTTSTSARRVFVSPNLNPGRDFHYNLKAEFVRDGRTVTVSKEVAVRAGNQTQVTFEPVAAAGVASR